MRKLSASLIRPDFWLVIHMNNNLLHKRFLDKEYKPGTAIIQKTLGKNAKAAWDDLQQFIDANYDLTCETVFYGSNYGWAVRYRKSGKTLCCLFPEDGAFSVLIVLGRKEVEKTNDSSSFHLSFCVNLRNSQQISQIAEHTRPE